MRGLRSRRRRQSVAWARRVSRRLARSIADQLLLGHRRAALDAEALGQVVEVPIRGVGIHTAGGPPALPGRRATHGGLVVRRTLVLPVGSQWSATLSKLCLRLSKAVRRERSPSPYCSSADSSFLAKVRCALPSIASAARWTGCRRDDPSA